MTTPQKVEIARNIVRIERGLKKLPAAGHSAVVEVSKLKLSDLRRRLKDAAEPIPADPAPRATFDEESGAIEFVQPQAVEAAPPPQVPDVEVELETDADGVLRPSHHVMTTDIDPAEVDMAEVHAFFAALRRRLGLSDAIRRPRAEIEAARTGRRAKVKAARKQRNAQGQAHRQARREARLARARFMAPEEVA